MTTIRVETILPVGIERAFDLAADLGEHVRSTAGTGERIVATTAVGPIREGDEVTFEARHLGVRWRLTSRIVEYDRPRRFVDQTVRGPFRSFRHEHDFEPVAGEGDGEGTRMVDTITFAAPFGPIGWIAERLLLRAHLTRFLRARNAYLVGERFTGNG